MPVHFYSECAMIRVLTGSGLLMALCLPLAAAEEPKGAGPPAADLLASASTRARERDKAVFMVFGSPT
jgi:hypothetical protein